jgi:hypothetical protein
MALGHSVRIVNRIGLCSKLFHDRLHDLFQASILQGQFERPGFFGLSHACPSLCHRLYHNLTSRAISQVTRLQTPRYRPWPILEGSHIERVARVGLIAHRGQEVVYSGKE